MNEGTARQKKEVHKQGALENKSSLTKLRL